jgi:hypothetical protein
MNAFHAHLAERGLTSERVWISEESELVYFPLWSPIGALVGYQRYTWNLPKIRSNAGKYFTWITEEYKPLGMWGLEYLSRPTSLAMPPDAVSQRVLVTEGIWDAIRCRQAGYNAVAVLTSTPSKQFVQWFRLVMQGKETIGILDNDENDAGKGLTKLCVTSIMCEHHKDIGEHTPNEARQWLRKQLSTL